jgi:hypothetical protein
MYIYNSLGQVVFSSPNHTTNDLNLSSLDMGIYTIVISKNDKIVYRNRVVLQ